MLTRILSAARIFARAWLTGVSAALSPRAAEVFLKSPTVRRLTCQCFLLNGLLFVGSLVLFEHAVSPAIRALLYRPTSSATFDTIMRATDRLYTILYYVLWVYPVYLVSFLLNAPMYADIASACARVAKLGTENVRPFTWDSLHTNLVQLIIANLLLMGLMVQGSLVGLLPVIGAPLNFLFMCWVASFYCFDYTWTQQSKTVAERTHSMERNWVFFFGFGTPFTVAVWFFPYFVSYGVFALLFPIFIVMAMIARPPADTLDKGRLGEMPMFRAPKWVVGKVMTSRLVPQPPSSMRTPSTVASSR